MPAMRTTLKCREGEIEERKRQYLRCLGRERISLFAADTKLDRVNI